MSDFEKWFRSLNANGKTVYFLGNEHKVSEMAWNHQQAVIDNLKAQLNNMEACYIEKKKQAEACAALVSEWREKPMGGWSDYARGGLHSRQDCADDLEKALRGDSCK